MILLALETAYDICGAAVLKDGELIAIEEMTAPRQQNEKLAGQVRGVMERADMPFTDLDAIAVSSGPGSYTGLRIGMSYAKGLAFGANLPIIPVPTLSAMVHGVRSEVNWVAAWSHRELFYAAKVGVVGAGEASTYELAELKDAIADQKVAIYLPAAANFEFGGKLLAICPSAENVGKFAYEQGLQPEVPIDGLVPNYIQNYQVKVK